MPLTCRAENALSGCETANGEPSRLSFRKPSRGPFRRADAAPVSGIISGAKTSERIWFLGKIKDARSIAGGSTMLQIENRGATRIV